MSRLIPRHDTGLEEAVLTAAILSNDKADEALAIVSPDDFYVPDNRAIFAAIKSLRDADSPVDIALVRAEAVKGRGTGGQSLGAYLYRVVGGTPAIGNVTSYATTLRDMARRRRWVEELHKLAGNGYDPTLGESDFFESCESTMSTLLQGGTSDDLVTQRDASVSFFADFADPEKREANTIATPWPAVNEQLGGGLFCGELAIIGARPGMGKTSCLDQIEVFHAEQTGEPVLDFSLEMAPKDRAARRICSRAKVPFKSVRRGYVDQGGWTALSGAAQELAALNLIMADRPGATVEYVCSKARAVAAEARRSGSRLRLVGIDYLTLMTPPQAAREDLAYGAITRRLQQLSRELGVAIVLLVQLSRGVERRDNKRPIMSDIREVGQVEQDASVIMFLYRDEYYRPDEHVEITAGGVTETVRNAGIAELVVAKGRNAGTGIVPLRFDAPNTTFHSYAPDPIGHDPFAEYDL